MVLAVLPALIPDIPRVYEVYFAAFKNEQMGRIMLDILFPNAVTDSPEFRKGHAAATLAYWHTSDVQYTFKVVDTDTGEIVGMALGDIFIRPRSEEERKNLGVPWLQGKERERAEKILNPLWEVREKLFGGRPYICMSRPPVFFFSADPGVFHPANTVPQRHSDSHVMGVDPKHQGRRAGAALLQWGRDMGERLQLPVYFESSPSTVGMYEKAGCERLEEKIVHKAEVTGTESDIEVPLMVMMPAGMSFKEWLKKGDPTSPCANGPK
jgi:GNAT superfamily N-acetyltransferase